MDSSQKYSPFRVIGLTILVSLFASSCELLGDTSLPDYAAITEISYGRHVQVLFEDQCTKCHDGQAAELSLVSWDEMVDGSASGGAVIPFAAGRSRMMRMIASRVEGAHPTELGGDTLSVAEVQFLSRWIDQGARNDLGEIPYADAVAKALVAVEDEAIIAVVAAKELAVARIIDLKKLGFSPDSRPRGLVSVPDGSGWFVSLPGEGVVLKFNETDVLSGIAEVDSPGSLSVSGNGQWLVVGRADGNPSGRVDIVSTADMRVRSVESVFPSSVASATRPHGDFGFSASRTADQIVSFALQGGAPNYVALSGPRHGVDQLLSNPEGSRLIAIGSESGRAVILDMTSPAHMVQLGSIRLGTSVRAASLMDNRLLAITGEGQVVSVESVSGATPSALATGDDATGIAGVGTWILVVGGNATSTQSFRDVSRAGSIRILDSVTGNTLRRIEIEGRPVSIVAR